MGVEWRTDRQSAVVIRHLQDMSGSWPEDRTVLQVDGIESKANTCWREEVKDQRTDELMVGFIARRCPNIRGRNIKR